MAKYDARFAGYATRVAFDIRLTRSQIFYLCALAHIYQDPPRDGEMARFQAIWTVRQDDGMPNLMAPMSRGLESRGLVHHTGNAWEITEAGRHVLALLEIAGLTIKFETPANEEKPRKRVKAGRA